MRHWMIGVGVVVLMLAGALWWRLSGASAAGIASRFDGTSLVESKQDVRDVRNARTGHTSIRLGGAGLNLERAVSAAYARPDGRDEALASAIHVAGGACINQVPLDHPAWKDADHRWALEYIRAACDGFDYERYNFATGDHGANWHFWVNGAEAATAKAHANLSRTDSLMLATDAADWLTRMEKLPDQASYGLTKDQMYNAALAAARLRTCGSMQACGADSMMTAIVCAEVGCPYGTTYQEAVRRQLSEREYAAALRLRDAFAR